MDALSFRRQTFFGAVERKGRGESIEMTADCTISRHVQMTGGGAKQEWHLTKRLRFSSGMTQTQTNNGARPCLRKNRHKFISVDFVLNFQVM